MKNKKNSIIISAIILILIAVVGLVIMVTSKNESAKPSAKENQAGLNSKDEVINRTFEDTVKSVNEINWVLKKENLEETKEVNTEGEFTCYKYMGEDTDVYIEKIQNTYIQAFDEYSNFKIKSEDDKNVLYICMPATCEIEDINDYKLVLDDEEEKSVDIGNATYTLLKEESAWKFVFPVLNCTE